MPYDPTYHAFPGVGQIRAIVARTRPDVLEVHSPYMAAIAALGSPDHDFGVRTFRWHSDFLDTYAMVAEWALRGHLPGLLARLPEPLRPLRLVGPLWGLVRRLGAGMDATLVSSRTQHDKLVARGVPRVRLVPFGVARTTVEPARVAARRDELTRGRPGKLLVAVGRFAVEKRWDVVLEASRRLANEVPHTLVLFGDGPERKRLEALAGPHVRFEGFVKDREALFSGLAAADALVHGCPCETFGLSIAEALSCGLPVVVPDAGGAGELGDGPHGARYPSLDPEACVRATLEVLARDRETSRKAARELAATFPTPEGELDALRDVYLELLAAPVRPRHTKP